MKKTLLSLIISTVLGSVSAQRIVFENKEFELINVKGEVVDFNGTKVLMLERDLDAYPFDPKTEEATVDGPTFARLLGTSLTNGVIELKMLSRIKPNSPFPAARGFIGIAFRVNEGYRNFDAIYLRPANGRADDQFRRNHTIQYFSYPDHKFARLRREANGLYETYADIGLNEWIDVRIEFQNRKATLYINNQKAPAFIVNEMLGVSTEGGIGLWVDIGTMGYFKDLKVTAK